VTTFPPLFKQTSDEGLQVWKIWVDPLPNGTCKIVCQYGRVDGKQQTKEEVITQGKNIGKKNETTPLAQANLEAQAKWTKQRDRKCYSEDPTGAASAAKRALSPMLAKVYEDYLKKIDWTSAYAQPKLDGFRCMV